MILQKQKSGNYNNKNYYKWVVIIPEVDIIVLGWKQGDKLKTRKNDGILIIEKKTKDLNIS